MGSSAPDIRVRLTAEGVKEVVDALRRVEREAGKATRQAASGVGVLNGALLNLKKLLPVLGVGAIGAGLVGLGRSALKAADEAGKLGQAVGATSEEISTLQFAAATANISNEQFRTGLIQLTRNVGELEKGSARQVNAFRKLGLTAKDFAGKTTGQAFDVVAQKLGGLESGTKRTQIALDLFGESGALLLPLLERLADDGFAAVEQEARDLGVLITGDLAAAAAAANDSFTLLQLQTRGLATAFLSGLAPSIVAAMADVSDSMETDGVEKIQEYGREAGRVLRVVIKTFQLFGTIVSGVFRGIGNQIGGFAALLEAAFNRDWQGVRTIWAAMGDQGDADFAELKADVVAGWAEIVEAATTEAPPIELKTRVTRDVVTGTTVEEDKAAEAARKKAEVERERLEKEAARRREEALGRIYDGEQKLLELQGRGREAALRELDIEIAKLREALTLRGDSVDQIEVFVTQYRELSTARLDLDELVAEGQAALDALARERTRIEQDVALGITSQFTAQDRILELEQSRLEVLEEIAKKARAAAEALGSEEAIAQAEALEEAIRGVAVSVASASDNLKKLKDGAKDAFQSGLENFLVDIADGAGTAEEAFKSLARGIAQAIQQIIAEIIAAEIVKAFLRSFSAGASGGGQVSAPGAATGGRVSSQGGGKVLRAATGGRIASGKVARAATGGEIRGPGTSTSDSIPSVVPDGTYIVRAAVVRKPGMLEFLRSLNAGRPASGGGKRAPVPVMLSNGEFAVRPSIVDQPGVLELLHDINAGRVSLRNLPAVPRFATGGVVGQAASAAAGAATSSQGGEGGQGGGNVRIVNVLDPDLVSSAIGSSEGERQIMNVIQRNATGIRRFLA